MGVFRINRSLLRQQEAAAVRFCVKRVPAWCTPDQLTGLSVAGSFIAGASLFCCWLSAWFVVPVVAGLFLNWFGDSLDGAVARYRSIERPRIGFLLDRGADVVSFTVIIIGLGLSPYLSLFSALMLLLVYFAHTIYVLLRNVIDGIHVIGLGGIGATEGRILIGGWAVFAHLVGPDIALARIDNILLLDVFYSLLFVSAIVTFALRLSADVRRIAGYDARRRSAAVAIKGNVVSIARADAPKTNSGGRGFLDESVRRGFIPATTRNSSVPH